MTRKFYCSHLLLGLMFHVLCLWSLFRSLSGAHFYIVLAAAACNTFFYPFPRLLLRRWALNYSNGEAWKYHSPQSSILVDTLASVVSFVFAAPVGIPFAVYMLYKSINGAR